MTMKQCINKFFNDKNYAISWALFGAVLVALLLSVLITFKAIDVVVGWSDDGNEYAANTISVRGTGEVTAVPDVATFNFSVNSTKPTVEEAQNEVTTKMNEAIAFLKEAGVEEKDIKTIGYNAYPKYEYTPCRTFDCVGTQEKLIGNEVSQVLEVKVRNTEKSGELLKGITERGATNISGLSFSIDDPEKLKEEARSKAIEDARDKADKLADDLDVKIKRVVSFYEENQDGPIMMEAKMSSYDGAVRNVENPNVPGGENEIKIVVSVTYEIK